MKNDPRVIAAYLGVDDEEVIDVLAEVGDDHVIEEFDGEPDRAHGPSDSASMMAGPVSDTIGHSDEAGETVKDCQGRLQGRADTTVSGLQRARSSARRLAGQAHADQGHRAGQRNEAARARHLPLRADRGLDEADIEAAEAYLEFDGRIAREDWIGQAKALAAKSGGAQ